MQGAVNRAATVCQNAETTKFLRRIGSTTYVVSVHFSQTSRETIDDKFLRLIQSSARNTA